VDPICDVFEAAWRAARSSGARPRIEDFVGDIAEPARKLLLRELVVSDAHFRRQVGEQPNPEDYQARFPDFNPVWLAAAGPGPGEIQGQPLNPGAPAGGKNCGKRLGDFEIVREIGRGGMGIVYEAVQISLKRKVALKVLSGGLGLTGKAVQRFRLEAEAAARLHHTNIVPVHATGEAEGTHYYAMELIDGPSLDHFIRKMRAGGSSDGRTVAGYATGSGLSPQLSQTGPYVESGSITTSAVARSSSSLPSASGYFDGVARMMAEVAEALEYAHGQGVVHRDMKPSNLLLSQAGRLSVNDFGLARLLEQPGITMTGEFVGTPAYMSPEQIAAHRTPIDHRTDVYSLGATLYELLTLQPAFSGERRDQVLAQILHKEPQAPRKLNPRAPVDLETICLKAMEKDPGRRYQTAGAMAGDLQRYVNRFAISARRAGPVQQLVKWARRRPAAAASLGCLLIAVGVALACAYWARYANQQRLLEQERARVQLFDQQERARLKLLDEKIRSAYLVASTGDLGSTDNAIKGIEELGASTGQVRLLRGVLAYFRQENETAINELEQAIKLLPESVAARALLAMAYADASQLEKYEAVIVTMAQLSPFSPEDYLFKGYASEQNEPGGVGLADLNEGIRQRDSPLGRALRTIARANRAIDSGRRQDAEAALADANAARGMLPDNPLALYASVYARVVAAGIYQEGKHSQERALVLQEAARDVQALEPFLGLPNPSFAASVYREALGERNEALAVARRGFERTGDPGGALYCAVNLYQQGSFAEALKLLDQRRQPERLGNMMRVFLLAELPDRPHPALEEYQKFAREYSPEGLSTQAKGVVLQFLGRKEQAQQEFRKARPEFAFSQAWKAFYEAVHQFDCGEHSEDLLLASAGSSRLRQCRAHYEIGLYRLARGDRAGAGNHFRMAADTRALWLYERDWSQMFLSRLDKDPRWPPWIPLIKGPP
jgi:serine/threonine protein kinase